MKCIYPSCMNPRPELGTCRYLGNCDGSAQPGWNLVTPHPITQALLATPAPQAQIDAEVATLAEEAVALLSRYDLSDAAWDDWERRASELLRLAAARNKGQQS